ncbi:MAG: plasmid stability protein [Gemmatimonadaceae bacterium]
MKKMSLIDAMNSVASSRAALKMKAFQLGFDTVPFRFHINPVIMPTLTLKGLPDALYERLKSQAVANRRSLNREIIFCLEQAVNTAPIDVNATLARLDKLREQAAIPYVTDRELREAKNDGRS